MRSTSPVFHQKSIVKEHFLCKAAYAQAMFSGENVPHKLEGEQPEFSDALAAAWATYAPQNAAAEVPPETASNPH